MNVTGIQPNAAWMNISGTQQTSGTSSFGDVLNQYIQQADSSIKDADNQALLVASGKSTNLQDMTIASQKASIAMQLTVQVRDKMLEAYQEMMRLQV
ncbi:flagellar hook-basal body complex protein FliE [Ectobacillus sp. sgz5001026]|uniref:flagellar hook-basal body complex protein FliE n=1 Tax=Ectobacillus sp. sgz5001026 TaxID=3242473 RepID=UPI0036D2FE35